MQLTDADLKFLVEALATERRDHAHIVELIRDKGDFLEQMLEDDKLLDRLLNDEERLVRVSPYLLFSVLLRAVRRGLENSGYLLEREGTGRRVAVFESGAVAGLLSRLETREYLVQMLCSFVRSNTGVIYWKERGTWQRQRFNDCDLEDMIALAGLVDPELKPRYYRRAAEIALFLSGVFPDRIARVQRRRASLRPERTLREYEESGRRFFKLAGRHPDESRQQFALEDLAEHFAQARSALNALSERFLKVNRLQYFAAPR